MLSPIWEFFHNSIDADFQLQRNEAMLKASR